MQGDKTLKTHEALMDRMARTLGADLDEAELRGELAPEIRHAMLLSCTGCSDPAGCAHWLDTHERAEAAPGYCRNGSVLADLARHD
ncbi:DUF6455 family protein [Roseicyclus sp.]|uniref:DUF6455 family protein n=1 Tax=Roseicyclus sp. TaxID=1914329 RepID=UPI003F9FFBDB